MSQLPLDRNLFNIDLLMLQPAQLKYLGEVKVANIFEPNSNLFSRDGLFSTEIFGPIGSPLRSETPGYINLHVDILHPLVYQQLVSLKSLYGEIMSGNKEVVFDNEINDFRIATSEDQDSGTGYTYFIDHLPKIAFVKGGDQRQARIDLVTKSLREKIWINKWVVLPAGLRDYEISKDGVSEDEVNDIYRSLLGSVSLLSNIKVTKDNLTMLDPIRLKIQNITLQLYLHFKELLDGKNKFIQGKWAKRAIVDGTRNVITPSVNLCTDLDDPNSITMDHTVMGLYQYIKSLPAIAAHRLHQKYINKILSPDNNNAVLVNPKSMSTEVVTIDIKKRDEWLTLEGLDDITSKLAQDSIKVSPITIDGYYMFLIYDDGKSIEVIFDTKNLDDTYNKKYLRPITYIELLYLAIYDIRDKYPAIVTRYPVASMGGVYPTKLYVKTTVTGRKVQFREQGNVRDIIEYPNLDDEFVASLSPHFCHLETLTADFDGDTMSANTMHTDESIAEIEKMLNDRKYYVSPEGEIIFTSSVGVNELVIAHMTA